MVKKVLFVHALMLCFLTSWSQNSSLKPGGFKYILDMVHNNPGEPPVLTSFNDPNKLVEYGYNAMVINDFVFVHAAITFDKLNPEIFPNGSESRKWVEDAARKVDEKIKACHDAGIKCLYFTDIIVLPKKLKELYSSEICDEKGNIDIHKPKTQEIHRLMIREIFERFPQLDGLVVRTGETYLNNVPFHTGNNPITQGPESHKVLLNILRDEVCVKANKLLFYRTWSFDGFHTDPKYYLDVTNAVEPHKNLFFLIKHTGGDYWRTFPFNKTLGIGKHKQIVEIQCQREYEGKGSFPNYIMDGVINGFEEYQGMQHPYCLNDIKDNPLIAGIWSWSRGGGWVGPYIKNELWCDLNAYVISHWAANPNATEQQIFDSYMDKLGIKGESRAKFRELCLLSQKGILRGHYFNKIKFPEAKPAHKYINWTRDQFLGGLDQLKPVIDTFIARGTLDTALAEKKEAVDIWDKIVKLANEIKVPDATTADYIKVSSKYGWFKFSIMYQGWIIMAEGRKGDISHTYDIEKINTAISAYDSLWKQYEEFAAANKQCATLYMPYSWKNKSPEYHELTGLQQTVDKYRAIVKNITTNSN